MAVVMSTCVKALVECFACCLFIDDRARTESWTRQRDDDEVVSDGGWFDNPYAQRVGGSGCQVEIQGQEVIVRVIYGVFVLSAASAGRVLGGATWCWKICKVSESLTRDLGRRLIKSPLKKKRATTPHFKHRSGGFYVNYWVAKTLKKKQNNRYSLFFMSIKDKHKIETVEHWIRITELCCSIWIQYFFKSVPLCEKSIEFFELLRDFFLLYFPL